MSLTKLRTRAAFAAFTVAALAALAPAPAVAASAFTSTPAPALSASTTSLVAVYTTVTATPKAWTPKATTVTYQWLRDGAAIPAATTTSYKLQGDDIGHKVSLRQTGSRSGYTTKSVTTAAVSVGDTWVSARAEPTVDGKYVSFGSIPWGKTIKVVLSQWDPAPTSITYQWYRSDKAVPGATSLTYKTTAADGPSVLELKIVARRPGFATRTLWTNLVNVQGRFFTFPKQSTVEIAGTLKVGKTVKAVYPKSSPAATSYTVQWYRLNADASKKTKISGATKVKYKLRSADVGHRLAVEVLYKRAGYWSGTPGTTYSGGAVRK